MILPEISRHLVILPIICVKSGQTTLSKLKLITLPAANSGKNISLTFSFGHFPALYRAMDMPEAAKFDRRKIIFLNS